MFTTRRQQLGDAGDDFLTAYGLDTAPAVDTTPSIALAQTGFGYDTYAPVAPVAPLVSPYSTPYAPPLGTSINAPSTAQQVVSTTNSLASLVNSIGQLFTGRPAAPAPVVINGVVQKPVVPAAASGGMSLTTILLLGAAGAAALILTQKKRGRRS